MSPGRFIKSEFEGIEMQHRYEDRALIVDVLQVRRPVWAMELGTAAGGFASLLARTVEEWGGEVLSVDKEPCPNAEALAARHSNLTLDCFNLLKWADWPIWVQNQLGCANILVYCDNGNKPEEIRLVAPRLQVGCTLGTHDYWTEVPVDWVEPHLANLGYRPLWHERFAALADAVNYPASLSRFWTRERA
jgi:hypothetical protein